MRTRRGFSLVEILVAMTLTLAVFAITLPFVRAQSRSLADSAGRLDAEQIARYAQRVIDRDLRLATSDPGQPLFVLAGPMAISFNANLLAADSTDPGALEVETGAASTLTEAWRVSDAATLPLSARTYPTVNYTGADGNASRVETISYFLHPDTFPDRTDIYVLYRRVNARDSVQVVRSLYVPEDSAFFTYQRMVSGSLTAVPIADLPFHWDTTAIDDIRAVSLRSSGYFKNRMTGEEVIRTVYWVTSVSNAVTTTSSSSCAGGTPGLPGNTGFAITKQSSSGPGASYRRRHLEFDWPKSANDAGSGSIASAYVIERRLTSDTLWKTISVVPAVDENNYEWWYDFGQLSGTYEFALRVVGCDGTYTARKAWSTVTLP